MSRPRHRPLSSALERGARLPLAFVRGAWLLAVLALSLSTARAAGTPTIQLQADADTVGVGDIVHLVMTVQSGDAPPADPQPGPLGGFTLRGQNASPSQTHISINGNRIDRWGLQVDYALQATRTGTFKLSPTVVVGGSRFTVSPVLVHVVPAGQAPPRPRSPQPSSPFGSLPFSPFDPWKGLIQPPDADPQPSPAVNLDPRLSLDAPRGAVYFLHATVDKTSCVVGEPVVFSVFEYLDTTASGGVEVDESDVHDATAADFVKHPLLREDQDAQLSGFGSVSGRPWQVKLVRRWALFPLHAGDLAIGPMSVTVTRPRNAAGKRTTETLTVHVSEPPAQGRPAGYALGDVGRFTLSAQVTPREVEQGGAVGVHVELSGTGNVPAALATPAREGVEWLTPETHDQLGVTGQTTYGGKRSFDYVVRVLRAGDIDLGELSLPYWDPDAKRYQTARAPLGAVHCTATASGAAASSAAAADDKLQGLPAPRDTLEAPQGAAPPRVHLDDARVFWLGGLGAWPAALGLVLAGTAAGRRLRGALRTRRTSPAAELKERIAAATVACEGADARAADAAVERALHSAAVAHAGVNLRGAVGVEVVARLAEAGVPRDVADEVWALLRECEAARFSPDTTDAAAIELSRERWARARKLLRALESRA